MAPHAHSSEVRSAPCRARSSAAAVTVDRPCSQAHVAATFLIGRAVAKDFKGQGTFNGRVTDFHRDTGFRVEYEDGDTEDLTEGDLVCAAPPRPAPPSRPRAALLAPRALARRRR